METTLFPEEEIAPAVVGVSPKERLIASYTTLLLNDPPVGSLRPESCPDEAERRRRARSIAAKDVPRLLRALKLSCMEVAESSRMAGAKHLLKQWLADFTEGQANGGNPTETDYEALANDTRAFLGKDFAL